MDSILQTLQDLEGVNAAILADRSGQVLAYRADPAYDAALLEQVSRRVVTAIDSVTVLHQDWESVTVQFSDGNLLIRSLPSGNPAAGPHLTLSVIADTRLNLSFAGVAIRVAVGKLKAIVEASARAKTPARSRAIVVAALAPGPVISTPTPAPLPLSLERRARGSAPDIVEKALAPALVAELEKYLEDLAMAGDAHDTVPKIP